MRAKLRMPLVGRGSGRAGSARAERVLDDHVLVAAEVLEHERELVAAGPFAPFGITAHWRDSSCLVPVATVSIVSKPCPLGASTPFTAIWMFAIREPFGFGAAQRRLAEQVAVGVEVGDDELDRAAGAHPLRDVEAQQQPLADAGLEVLLDLRVGERLLVDREQADLALPRPAAVRLGAEREAVARIPVPEAATASIGSTSPVKRPST